MIRMVVAVTDALDNELNKGGRCRIVNEIYRRACNRSAYTSVQASFWNGAPHREPEGKRGA